MHHERVMLGNWCDHSWNFEFWEQNVSNHKRLLDKPCIWVKHPLGNAFAVFSSQHSLSEPALISHCYIDAYISAIEILGKTSLRFLSWRLRLSDLVLNNALILSDDFSLNIWSIVILVTCWFSGYRKSAMIPILPCDVNHTLLIFIALIYCWFIAMLFKGRRDWMNSKIICQNQPCTASSLQFAICRSQANGTNPDTSRAHSLKGTNAGPNKFSTFQVSLCLLCLRLFFRIMLFLICSRLQVTFACELAYIVLYSAVLTRSFR